MFFLYLFPPDQDIAFVLYYIVFFSWCRECLAIYVLKPVARHYGVRRLAKVDRFAEQGYAVIYFTAAGSLGLVRFLATFGSRDELTCPFSLL
jgi:very-long-chain ceramide synthase